MRLLLITAALLASGTALAQPEPKREDRHPAYVAEPVESKTVRTIPISPTHAFEERWAPIPPPRSQNAPTGLPAATGIVPVPGNRLRHDPIKAQPLARAAAADICTRHGLRKVWHGKSWRCR